MTEYTPGQLARLLRVPEPTAEQAAVIGAPLGPLAVIAGAGSGKSETMAARLVWLVANGLVRPDRVLGLTFTRKAAAELAERVRSRLDALVRLGEPGSGEGSGGCSWTAGGAAAASAGGATVSSCFSRAGTSLRFITISSACAPGPSGKSCRHAAT